MTLGPSFHPTLLRIHLSDICQPDAFHVEGIRSAETRLARLSCLQDVEASHIQNKDATLTHSYCYLIQVSTAIFVHALTRHEVNRFCGPTLVKS